MSKRIQKIYKIIFLFLLFTLPVQNLITQSLVFKLNLPEFFALYKEVLVIILITLSTLFILAQIFKKSQTNKIKKTENQNNLANSNQLLKTKLNFKNLLKKYFWTFPIVVFISLNLLLVFSSILNQTPFSIFFLGYRFDLFWLGFFSFSLAFLAFLKQEKLDFFDADFSILATRVLLFGFALVAVLSLIQSLLGIAQFNQFFRPLEKNTDQTIAQTVCHRIDFQIDSCRLNGPFSSPNHFSGYLLFVLPFLSLVFFSSLNLLLNKNFLKIPEDFVLRVLAVKNVSKPLSKTKKVIVLAISSLSILFILTMIIFSYSRYSWLSTVLFFAILFLALMLEFFEKKKILSSDLILKFWKFGLTFGLFISFFFGLFIINLNPTGFIHDLPEVVKSIVKPSSTTDHFRHFQASMDVYKEAGLTRQLFGFGSGSSGPSASNEYQNMHQNPIVLNHGEIAARWFIFDIHLGIPENWFLQILLNGGIFYLLLYLLLVFVPYYIFYKNLKLKNFSDINFVKTILFLPFHLIVFGNLLLHIWENQTIALYWTLIYVLLFTYFQTSFFAKSGLTKI